MDMEYWHSGHILQVKEQILKNMRAYTILYNICMTQIAEIMKKETEEVKRQLTNYEIY